MIAASKTWTHVWRGRKIPELKGERCRIKAMHSAECQITIEFKNGGYMDCMTWSIRRTAGSEK